MDSHSGLDLKVSLKGTASQRILSLHMVNYNSISGLVEQKRLWKKRIRQIKNGPKLIKVGRERVRK